MASSHGASGRVEFGRLVASKRRRATAVEASIRPVVEAVERRVLLSAAASVIHGQIASGRAFAPRYSDTTAETTAYLPPQYSAVNYGDGFLSPPAAGKPLDVALAYLAAHAADFGATAADVASATVTDQYSDPDTGVTHVYLRERVNGLDVANANLSISLTKDNQIITAGGGFVPATVGAANALPVTSQPKRTATQAVQDFATHAGLHAAAAGPRVVSAARTGRRHTVLAARDLSLDDIPADLHYVATAGGLKLAWSVVLRTTDRQHWYSASVDASTGQVVAANDWIEHALYDVYAIPTESPADGPRTIITDPQDPAFSPYGWHDTNGVAGAEFTDTRGNNVSAQEDADANNTGGFRPEGGTDLNFDFPVFPTSSPDASQAAAITNLFYWNNLLHDVHAEYGFTEVAGNFQVKNYTGTGKGNDSVQADALDGSGVDNANFATPPDGQSPRMQMYQFVDTSPGRDGDFDTQIIVHEYGHGVSNRLTGGPANSDALDAIQSGGMGEGWSDWWGLMFTQKSTDTQNAAYPVGTYVLGQPNTGSGIRRYPYSFNQTTDPLTFAAYNADAAQEVHRTGEIWCSTLWDLNWLLINKYGYSPTIAGGYNPAVAGKNGGNNLALKLVSDALKLQPANPSFTQARDAILAADQALTGGADQLEIWTAFARRGLGYSAATASANATSVTTATDLPPSLTNPRVTASAPAGVRTTPVDHLDFTFNRAMNPATFAVADDVASFTGPGGADLRGTITGSSWLSGNTVLRITFAAPTADGQYALTIGPQILAASDGKAMDQDGDGTLGEAVDDRYTARFGYDTLVLQVASTAPAAGSLVSVPFTTLDVTFNEPFDPATIGTSDLTLNQGTVAGAAVVNATTARYTLAGVTAEGTLTASFVAGALTDVYGNPSGAAVVNYTLDAATTPFPALTAEAPSGSLIYDGTAAASVGAAGDTDAFTINLDPGQTLSLVARPAAGLRPTLELRDPGGAVVATTAGATAGKAALVQTVPVSAAGVYTVTVGGADGTAGTYALGLTLNAAVEEENYNRPTNDNLASAQNIDSAFTSLGGSAGRAGVTGSSTSPTGATGVFLADFEDGDDGFTVSNGTTGLWHLSTGRGSQAGHSPTHSFYFGKNEGPNGGGTYATGARTSGTLDSPSIHLPAAEAVQLDFSYVLQTENLPAWDLAQVQVSTDGGDTYSTVATYNGSAESSTWKTAAPVTLTPYAGQDVRLRWKFDTRDGVSNGYEGWYVDDVRVQAFFSSVDYYSLTLQAGQSLSAAVKSVAGNQDVKIYDPAGQVAATGAAGAANANAESAVASFIAPATGTYAVRVGGPGGTAYQLVVTRGAAFDLEPNNTTTGGQNIDAAGGVVLGSTVPNDDYYRFSARAGDAITFSTATPGDGPGLFNNVLNPRLDLYAPTGSPLTGNDNGAADGRNALLTYTIPTTGTYTVRVSNSVPGATGGEYVLTLAGATSSNVPDAPDLLPATDAGVATTDNNTNFNNASPDKALQFSVGGTRPGATVTIYADGTAVGSAVASGTTTAVTTNGTAALADGSHTITARQTPAGGTESTNSAPLIVTIDSVAPLKPPAPDLTDASDAGVSNSDNLTNVKAPSFAVASDPFYRVYVDGVQVAGSYRAGSTFTSDPLADGTYAFTSTAVDVAGNVSPPSDPVSVTIDTAPPAAAAAAPDVSAAGGTGYVFTVTYADGAGVDVASLDGADVAVTGPNGFSQLAAFVSVDAASNGTPRTATYRITPPGGSWDVGDNGTYAVTLQPGAVRDVAGNVAVAGNVGTFAVSTPLTAPASMDLTDASDTGVSPTDNLTRLNNSGASQVLAFTVGGTAVGATVTVYADGVPVGTAAGTAGSTLVRTDGAHTLADGVRVFTARQSVAGQPESPDSPALAVTINTTLPAAVAAAPDVTTAGGTSYEFTVTFTDDVGVDVASLASAYVRVTGPTGAIQNAIPVSIDVSGDGTPRTATYRITPPGGSWNGDNSGVYTVILLPSSARDTAGNSAGSPTTLGTFRVVTPILQPLDLTSVADTGISSTDDLTNRSNSGLQFAVSGAAPGATLYLYADGILIGSGTAVSSNTFVSSNGTVTLADGVHLFTVRQAFPGGTLTADSPPLAVTIDATRPPVPPAPILQTASESGVSLSDNITNVRTPTIEVLSQTYYRLTRDGSFVGTSQYLTGLYVSPPLSDRTYSFRASAADAAGNFSSVSDPLVVTIDTARPTVAVLPVDPSPPTGPVDSLPVRFSEPPAGFDLSDLTFTRDGGPNLLTAAQTLTTADGLTWSLGNLTPLSLTPGHYTFGVKGVGTGITDVAGNTLTGGGSRKFVISPSAPVPVPAGGFEAPAVGAGTGAYQYAPPGAGWTFTPPAGRDGSGVAGGGSDLTAGNPPAPEGTQVAFLRGAGSFSQAVAGWQAGAYVVQFAAAQRIDAAGGLAAEDFQVLVDGAVVGVFKPSAAAYTTNATAAFVVPAGAHTVTFQGLNTAGGDNFALVDDVRIVGAPTLPVGVVASPEAQFTFANGTLRLTRGTLTLADNFAYDAIDLIVEGTDSHLVFGGL